MVKDLDRYQQKVVDLIATGNTSFFVTGKAGTGKTTVLQKAVEAATANGKLVAVIAPTGVAAKHAGGITVHSFLHLKPAPFIPGKGIVPQLYKKIDDAYIKYLKELDTVIVDEVSMVRCDVMDAMDAILKYYRGNDKKPFGGVQMVLFGDLYQLMPVVEENQEKLLKKHYTQNGYYFFNSDVISKNPIKVLELYNVYRQKKDIEFVNILNNVRDGKLLASDIVKLEKRYKPYYVNDNVIRITTHNYKARRYNDDRLEDLPGNGREYNAFITPYFPYSEYPTTAKLVLKENARVMFVKNDTDLGCYVNGTLGKVISLNEKSVRVLTDEGVTVDVERDIWDFEEYKYDPKTKTVKIEKKGSFEQLPLRLAWSVTIHKSQGLTFDEVIIDARSSFAFGQIYVALSRCRTLEGITLTSKLDSKKVQNDPLVVAYMKNLEHIMISGSSKESFVPVTTSDLSNKDIIWPKLSDTQKKTLSYINKGIKEVSTIAQKRDFSVSTIYSHVVDLIEKGYVDVYDFVDAKKVETITKMIEASGVDTYATEIIEKAPIPLDYNEIRMARAFYKLNVNNKASKQIVKPSIVPQNTPVPIESKPKKAANIKSESIGSYWNKSDDEVLLQLVDEGYNFEEIAEVFGRSIFDISHRLLQLVRVKQTTAVSNKQIEKTSIDIDKEISILEEKWEKEDKFEREEAEGRKKTIASIYEDSGLMHRTSKQERIHTESIYDRMTSLVEEILEKNPYLQVDSRLISSFEKSALQSITESSLPNNIKVLIRNVFNAKTLKPLSLSNGKIKKIMAVLENNNELYCDLIGLFMRVNCKLYDILKISLK